MARGGMRIGEVLKLKAKDVYDRKLFLSDPKSGRQTEIVKNAGIMTNVALKPHDLRRHAATYASRSGLPIEIVSKIILRHANLSTTQRYIAR